MSNLCLSFFPTASQPLNTVAGADFGGPGKLVTVFHLSLSSNSAFASSTLYSTVMRKCGSPSFRTMPVQLGSGEVQNAGVVTGFGTLICAVLEREERSNFDGARCFDSAHAADVEKGAAG